MQHLREHYQRLDTGELLDIAGQELTEEARATLDSVLAERGVPPAEVAQARYERLRRAQVEAAIQGVLAARRERLIAFLIDSAGSMAVFAVAFYPLRLLSVETHAEVCMTACAGYFLERDAMRNGSIGKRIMGMRVIDAKSGASCTRLQSLIRNLAHVLVYLDWVGILGHRRSRLGDRFAGTAVVRVAED